MTFHRVLDLPDADLVVSAGGVPYMVQQTVFPNTKQIWMAGNGHAPAFKANGVASPMLSPDRSRLLYLSGSGSAGDGASLVVNTVVGSSPSTIKTASGGGLRSPYWLDNDRIIYIFVNNTFLGPHTINVINRDGTGDTTLYTSTSYGIPIFASASPSSNYIQFSIRREDVGEFVVPNELWLMNADGSSPTKIYTAATVGALQFERYMNWCWQHNADVVGFCEITGFGPTTYRWRKMNYDGSGQTDLYVGGTWANTGASIHSWLSDDSAMIGMVDNGGSAPVYQLYKIAADGSGRTAISPSRFSWTGSFGEYRATPCAIDGRIYWVDTQFNTELVSIAEDGSDYTVEHTFATNNLDWHGFLYFGQ